MSPTARKPIPHLFSGLHYRGLRIGLLGGSFNPAHEGHVHISLLALKEMKLDAVWWLVSPQNPLKSAEQMETFASRFKSAQALTATHTRIIVSDIECRLGTRYTADTLHVLKKRFPGTAFIWMMGADNLLQIPRWQRWHNIFKGTDVAVFRRPPYLVGVLRGCAAQRFSGTRLGPRKGKFLGYGKSKHWILFSNLLNGESATHIRTTRLENGQQADGKK